MLALAGFLVGSEGMGLGLLGLVLGRHGRRRKTQSKDREDELVGWKSWEIRRVMLMTQSADGLIEWVNSDYFGEV